jgi:hypothetical protein
MSIDLARQFVSFAGAMLILVAYVGHQLGRMNSRRTAYNVLNAVGSAILGRIALRPFQLGFVALEVTWAVVSVWALLRPRQA